MVKQPNIKIDDNAKIIITASTIFFVTIFACFLINKVRSQKLEAIKLEIIEARKQLVLRRDLEKIAIIKGKYALLFYKETAPNVLRNKISSLVNNSGLSLLSIETNPTVSINMYTKTPFDIKLRGSYRQLAQFLEKVETLPELTMVDNIFLTSAGDYHNMSKKDISKINFNKETETDISLLISTYSYTGK
ncbi:type 4a pilus biogenesis protein PilO [Candidatus Omnitrophota bacterium]